MPSILTGPDFSSAEPLPKREAKVIGQGSQARPSLLLESTQPAPIPHETSKKVDMRDFGDSTATRKAIYDNVFKAAQMVKPVGNVRYRLELSKVHWADPDKISITDQKKAILEGRTLQRRLRGTWTLVDATTGKPVDSKTSTVAHVPHLTQRGTFILNGNEYTLAHQMRLRAGIYHRMKENGEIEAHANIMPGKGLSHHYYLEPETGVFKVQIRQSNIPLMPLLRAMGAKDSELREHWGPELFAANMAKDDPKVMDKLYTRLVKKGDPRASREEKSRAVVEALTAMELDPEVTARTLGHPHKNMSKEAILASTKKLLGISRGEVEADDRDHLAFQHFLGPEDLIAERLGRDRGLLNQLLWKSTTRGNLQSMPAGAFTRHVHAAIMDSGLGMPLEEINPADVFDQQTRVTRLGYGGIPSIDSVPDECYDELTEVFTSEGWVPWPRVTEETLFGCLIDGRLEFHKTQRLIRKVYRGPLYGVTTRTLDILVTPNHRHWVRKYRGGSGLNRCGLAPWTFELAKDAYRKPREFLLTHLPYIGEPQASFTPPPVAGSRKEYATLDLDDWAELMGWYVAEGSLDTYALREKGKYQVYISQDEMANPEKVDRLGQLLTRLGIAHSYQGHNFVFVSKQLGTYFAALGIGAGDKHLPAECFYWPESARRRLFDALCMGDGHFNDNGSRRYCSASRILVDQVVRLATTLGLATSVWESRVYDNPNHADSHMCNILASTVQGVTSERMYDNSYYTQNYDGLVYCAEVPGELLLVRRRGSVPTWSGNSRNVQPSHLGYIDLLRTPESFKVGVDSRVSYVARKGSDHRIYTPFMNAQTGKIEYKAPQDVADLTLAFPGEMETRKPFVAAMVKGKTRYVPRDQVQYVMPHMEQAFSPVNNMVPLKRTIKGQRAAMASRFITQALPLANAEAPFVRGQVPGQPGRSFEEHYGRHMGAAFAKDQSGRVAKVTPEAITVRYADGTTEDHEIYDHFPYNRKTYLHSTPTVREGDPVRPGQLLARSNYTDNKGTVALGMNARVAYIPFRGLNYEDAYVISDGFAKRLSSEHMYQQAHEWEDKTRRGKLAYASIFPSKYTRETLNKLDDRGVIKPGTVVKFGDPLILAATEREITHKQVHSAHKGSFADRSVTWDHHSDGIVTDVAHTDKGVTVAVKALSPSQVGDKISGRYGDKGVISAIIPDDEMPHGEDGKPYEVLANPLGVVSRTNPGQINEAVLGKIAEKTGKPYTVDDYALPDVTEWTKGELQKHGLKDLETITDPQTGRTVPNVLTGNRFFMKLHHTSESKGQGRGLGAYTAEEMPARGGEEGSKRLALMDVNALLSHGALDVLHDAKLIRGQKNTEYWSSYMSGFRPPTPKVPLVYEKFINQLKAAGINVLRKGNQTHIMALTDTDVDKLSEGREIKNVDTVDWKAGLRPIPGGLFDVNLTGGHGGNRWANIKLIESMPNPAFEEPIRRLLGLTGKQFENVLSGREKLHGRTGPDAIAKALGAINVDSALAQAREDVASGRKTARDTAIRKMGYLKSSQRLGIHPREWMLNKVPVLPPLFRPVSVMAQSGRPMVNDANYLYKEVFDANKALGELKNVVEDVGDERLNLYHAFKAVTGLGDPIQPKNQEKQIKGMLAQIFGSSAKFGTVQQKLLGTNVELVGRAVVVPNPDLHMDEVGLPENRAWEVYTPFIIRRLVRQGVPRVTAVEYARNRTDLARRAMLTEMEERPVLVNRAPVLHRYGMMAFKPRLTKGDVLQVSPIVVGGFGMDFDGDASNYQVPASDEAREEALAKMLPSRNLISTATLKQPMYVPRQEYVGGLHSATSRIDKAKRPRVFATSRDAVRAYFAGALDPDQRIEILNP